MIFLNRKRGLDLRSVFACLMVGMECKLCSKKFSNGKALGGHMRSHYATLPLPPKTPQRHELSDPPTDSTSSIFSGDERESSGEKSSLSLSYCLRENPKKSFTFVDPESFDVGSVVVDRESETESTRGRCKRAEGTSVEDDDPERFLQKPIPGAPLTELEIDEDVALCLIMLSRDVCRRSSEESRTSREVLKCERCDKVFKSSQGLGSHRASHFKKIRNSVLGNELMRRKADKIVVVREQVHECPFCDKVFKSAQALGGHKRSHYLPSKTIANLQSPAIDLNLPAAMEDDDEFLSERKLFITSFSGAEFADQIKK